MISFVRSLKRFWNPQSPAQDISSPSFPTIDSSLEIEEENEPFYSSTIFYPARIGEVLNSRYQIVGKLGYGGYSTVWLCRDLEDRKFVSLKLCRSDATNQIKREIDAYKHLNTVSATLEGVSLVRHMLDSFDLRVDQHVFPCLVHDTLGISIRKFRAIMPNEKLLEDFLKSVLIHVLIALDFLHSEANIIHADIQENNILLGIDDATVLEDFEKQERENPTPRKIDGERVIYRSRMLDNADDAGRPILTDFGEARLGKTTHTGLIQPLQYRAPEVLLKMPWDNKVDIWNIGVMIWDLFEDKNMFSGRDEQNEASTSHHLAQMVGILGPPPADFIVRSSVASEYFNVDGSWKGAVEISKTSLEESEENLEGESKVLFLAFVRKMLKWKPEERLTAHQLLCDPWLRDGDQFVDE